MKVLVAEGKQENAVELGIEFLRMARLYDEEPLLVNALVGIAVRSIMANGLYDALAAGPISPKLRAELDHELALHDDPQRVVRVMKTERAYSASAIAEFGLGPPVETPHPILGRMFGWVIQRQFLGVLDFYDEQLKLLPMPWPEVHKQVGDKGAVDVSRFRAMADLTIPAVQALYEAEMRCIATLRALRIFSALTAFAEKNGREAAGLEELGLLKEAMIDPFRGEFLKLKDTKDG